MPATTLVLERVHCGSSSIRLATFLGHPIHYPFITSIWGGLYLFLVKNKQEIASSYWGLLLTPMLPSCIWVKTQQMSAGQSHFHYPKNTFMERGGCLFLFERSIHINICPHTKLPLWSHLALSLQIQLYLQQPWRGIAMACWGIGMAVKDSLILEWSGKYSRFGYSMTS